MPCRARATDHTACAFCAYDIEPNSRMTKSRSFSSTELRHPMKPLAGVICRCRRAIELAWSVGRHAWWSRAHISTRVLNEVTTRPGCVEPLPKADKPPGSAAMGVVATPALLKEAASLLGERRTDRGYTYVAAGHELRREHPERALREPRSELAPPTGAASSLVPVHARLEVCGAVEEDTARRTVNARRYPQMSASGFNVQGLDRRRGRPAVHPIGAPVRLAAANSFNADTARQVSAPSRRAFVFSPPRLAHCRRPCVGAGGDVGLADGDAEHQRRQHLS
eukprot:2037852-Prymnesium_polylepis.2